MCDASITDYSLFLTKTSMYNRPAYVHKMTNEHERKITLTTADGVLRLHSHKKLTALEIN